jgi:hypothetical protein
MFHHGTSMRTRELPLKDPTSSGQISFLNESFEPIGTVLGGLEESFACRFITIICRIFENPIAEYQILLIDRC